MVEDPETETDRRGWTGELLSLFTMARSGRVREVLKRLRGFGFVFEYVVWAVDEEVVAVETVPG